MNTIKKGSEPFELFSDSLTEELMSMTDSDVLEGLNPSSVKLDGLRILAKAKAKAGQLRLSAARAAIEGRNRVSTLSGTPVSPNDARAYLQSVANDTRFTLAARDLGELSDEDILRLYRQAKQLQSEFGNGDADEK